MKNRSAILISFFLILSVAIPASAQSLTAPEESTIIREIDANFARMLAYGEKLDYDKLSSGVDDSREAGFITNGNFYAQYATLIANMKTAAKGIDRQVFSIREKKITPLSDRLALMTVSGSATIYLADGRELPVNFLWSFVYEKAGDEWKVIHSHQSSRN
ncbi:nuclear transport factor 2 family protein [Mangrovibacterium diazotrophicum]|uniref:SnoaL-like protein n=1 Tax=Mangrovibacterium diazotrophicum TaxID=1261403 RepID=A0A419W4Y4_9BACT|nr:nuclear transport factor 2 family protein [Mangrovibacterium diazotrophicum]RKD90513.1 SnoaL-like protein [Mangrovibacterium diazotrophicum]